MSLTQIRLCESIITSHFDQIVAKVGVALVKRGRQSVAQLKSPHSSCPGLKSFQILDALAVLIQHNLVTHAEDAKGTTYYTIDASAVISRLYIGHVLQLTHQMNGEQARNIVQIVMLHGCATKETIMSQLSSAVLGGVDEDTLDARERGNLIQTRRNALNELVTMHFLTAVSEQTYITPEDRKMADEKRLTPKDAILSLTAAQKRTLEKQVQTAQDESNELIATAGIRKRKTNPGAAASSSTAASSKKTATGAKKKAKLNIKLDTEDGNEDDEDDADGFGIRNGPTGKGKARANGSSGTVEDMVADDVYFRVNFDKFGVLIRNQIIIDAARDRINPGAGEVMRAFLENGEANMRTPLETTSPASSSTHVARALNTRAAALVRRQIVLSDSSSSGSNGSRRNGGGGRRRGGDMDDDYDGYDDDDDDDGHGAGSEESRIAAATQAAVSGFMEVMTNDTTPFLIRATDVGAGSYRVPFNRTCRALSIQAMINVVGMKFDDKAARLMRLLIATGKLEDRQHQLPTLALMASKSMRDSLNSLMRAGFINIQEVPRTADRAPARTIFLYFVDTRKACGIAAEMCRRSIINLRKRLKFERERDERRELLLKIQREDVARDMSLLSENERAELDLLRKIEMQIETSQQQLMETLFLLENTPFEVSA
ncbi:hypothetical protein GQ42DRAFT_160958 [Ramicandelaber brevisporus]|nr:hypothetical protein GQ42DRAFT_160958 [Ramicandelaber brevisporus]